MDYLFLHCAWEPLEPDILSVSVGTNAPISSQDFNKANAGEEQPCFSVRTWRLQIDYSGIKNSLEFFSLPIIIFSYPRVLVQLLQNPAVLILLGYRFLLQRALSLCLFWGQGELFVQPHLLSSDIKVSQFTPPSLILPFSLTPMFCKFPCILSYPAPVVFVSRFTFTLEVLARRQRPSDSTFHSTACSCESPTAGQVNCLERRALQEGDINRNKTVPVTAFLWDCFFWRLRNNVGNCSSCCLKIPSRQFLTEKWKSFGDRGRGIN